MWIYKNPKFSKFTQFKNFHNPPHNPKKIKQKQIPINETTHPIYHSHITQTYYTTRHSKMSWPVVMKLLITLLVPSGRCYTLPRSMAMPWKLLLLLATTMAVFAVMRLWLSLSVELLQSCVFRLLGRWCFVGCAWFGWGKSAGATMCWLNLIIDVNLILNGTNRYKYWFVFVQFGTH